MARKTGAPLLNVLPIPGDLDTRCRNVWTREFGTAGLGHFAGADLPAMREHVRLVIEAEDARDRMLAMDYKPAAALHYRAMTGMVLASRRMLRMVPSSRLSKQRAATIAQTSPTADPSTGWRSLFPQNGNVAALPKAKR